MKDKFGKYYRSYKLISINWKPVIRHIYAVNKSQTNNTKIIGPIRAAKKIFNSWCENNENNEDGIIFGIQEITRGCAKKIYIYNGTRIEKKQNTKVLYNNTTTNSTKKTCIVYKYDLIISPYIKNT